jgi:chitinase
MTIVKYPSRVSYGAALLLALLVVLVVGVSAFSRAVRTTDNRISHRRRWLSNTTTDAVVVNNLRMKSNKSLPDTVLIGYGSDIDAVRQAVHQGVNIVTWAFLDVVHVVVNTSSDDDVSTATPRRRTRQQHEPPDAKLETTLDLDGIRSLKAQLEVTGYEHVLHFASVGGWNGPHLDPRLSANEWFTTFHIEVGDVFDGIDWDLEGHDDLSSPTNYLTRRCLDTMGAISQLAKAHNYYISMAPPQSYLDFYDGSHHSFSRYVNLTDPTRSWHADFHYFGSNVYAYLLADKYEPWIDLVAIQYYESYSRAAMMVKDKNMTASDYLVDYCQRPLSLRVNFSEDWELALPDQTITLDRSKLVLGFANGWTDADNDKTLYVSPVEIASAWSRLGSLGARPRGLMFWTIDEEGTKGVYFAQELSQILLNESNIIGES